MTSEQRQELVSKGQVTVETAVERYGIARSSLYELMQKGEVAYTKIGKRRYVLVASLNALMERHLVGAG